MTIPAPRSIAELRADGYFHQACLDAAFLPTLSTAMAVEAGDTDGENVQIRLSFSGHRPTELTGQRLARILPTGVWQWLHPRIAEAAEEFAIPELEHEWVAPRPPELDLETATRLLADDAGDAAEADDATPRAYRSLATAEELAAAIRTLFCNDPVLFLPTADGATIMATVPAAAAADCHRTLFHAGAFMPASPDMDRSIDGLARLFECEYRPCGAGRYELRVAGQIVGVSTRESIVVDYGHGMSFAQVLRDAQQVPASYPPATDPAVTAHPAIVQMAHTNGIPALLRIEGAQSATLTADIHRARRCVLYRSGAMPPPPTVPPGMPPQGSVSQGSAPQAPQNPAGAPRGDGTTPVSQPPST
ncbi:hypothetical protein [Corynebacterium sp. TAE3-ERU2]|uniref:hypothetical protein n=1 Tax=Corynebacterium sp. TAE3-ERU2 TaxID=2849497 RepID=UPI001C47048E|nr:hypothetical protein [Corynebacterium sp. TAE3-ERU2]MBV7301865.1 hypothetical protein [Corynebacterium sp. TAE3-ERU2]